VSTVAELAAAAREHGRLGLDTEFMPEGRYKPLLCLVQIAVGDEIAVLDPMDGFDPEPPPVDFHASCLFRPHVPYKYYARK